MDSGDEDEDRDKGQDERVESRYLRKRSLSSVITHFSHGMDVAQEEEHHLPEETSGGGYAATCTTAPTRSTGPVTRSAAVPRSFRPGTQVSLRLTDLLPNLSQSNFGEKLRSQSKSVKKPEEIAVGPFVVERVSKDQKRVYVKSLAPFPSTENKQKAFDINFVSIYTTKKEPKMYKRPSRYTVDGENHWIVEGILDKRNKNKQNRYLVKWKGFSYLESTWELKECFPEDLINFFGGST
jgi:hypothetical protein